jgi:ligand-binding sensor domain-containing protein
MLRGLKAKTISAINRNRRLSAFIAAAIVVAVAAGIYFYIDYVNRTIRAERERLAGEDRVDVEVSQLRAPSTDGVTALVNASEARAVAAFNGSRYLATGGGLVELDDAGGVRRRYTTSDGLPANALTALAVFRDRLFIGTSSAGLISFDGNSFTGYRFKKPAAVNISALASTESELFIGTLDAGLIEYDGEQFSRRLKSAPGADFKRVTSILPHDSRLYIGTYDEGLYIWREAQMWRVGVAEGLPSRRVTALAVMPDSFSEYGLVAVATDFGLVGLNDADEIKPISNRANVTSLVVSEGKLWAGLFGGGIIDLGASRAASQGQSSGAPNSLSETPGLPRSEPALVAVTDGHLWALTREGAYLRSEGSQSPRFSPVAASIVGGRVLTADHVTGLAFDQSGRLWVGYFDRGIDLLSRELTERLAHLEDERVREVNFIAADTVESRMLIATSRGLVAYDAGLNQSVITRARNGIVDDAIAHVSLKATPLPVSTRPGTTALDGRVTVLATAGGLTQLSGGRARSLTAFHGLASNHLYSTAVSGSRLFVGSSAGLVELEGLRVVRSYRAANSPLSHDWVSALAAVEGSLFVGTNGGGVDMLLPTGEWTSFADELGRFEVNQNAMHFDGERLYVGTTDRGILVYNTRARRWSRLQAGLPSQNVTAIISDGESVYAGTLGGLARIEKRIIDR